MSSRLVARLLVVFHHDLIITIHLATNPLDADPGSIRGQYCISVGRNIIHGSDSLDSAAIEIPLWFTPQELNDWKYTHEEWITSKN